MAHRRRKGCTAISGSFRYAEVFYRFFAGLAALLLPAKSLNFYSGDSRSDGLRSRPKDD
jgi:hypothetical protein